MARAARSARGGGSDGDRLSAGGARCPGRARGAGRGGTRLSRVERPGEPAERVARARGRVGRSARPYRKGALEAVPAVASANGFDRASGAESPALATDSAPAAGSASAYGMLKSTP